MLSNMKNFKELSFDQKLFLMNFKRFYGFNYTCRYLDHILAQNMSHLLDLNLSMYTGHYKFEWDSKGPKSKGLEVTLNELDINKDIVKSFYENEISRKYVFYTTDFNKFKSNLHIKKHSKDIESWTNLLSCLMYFRKKSSDLSFKDAVDVLNMNITWYSYDETYIKKAWECTNKAYERFFPKLGIIKF